MIDRYGVEHQYIEIELTESEDFQDYERMAEIVGQLAENGIMTSVDDFGTGFSSLNMIKRVNIDVIKIDRSFIPLEQEYQGKKKDMIMFCSIVDLVKNWENGLWQKAWKRWNSCSILRRPAVMLCKATYLTSRCRRPNLKNDCVDDFEYLSILLQRARA